MMKTAFPIRNWIRSVCAAAAAACLLLAAAPPARAADDRFDGKDWDQVIEEFLAQYNAKEGQVTIGYYNTVTGEEHYYDPDRYMISGSMYKVPLCMVFAEKEANGEIEWEDLSKSGYRFGVLVEGAIVHSNNDYAAMLWKQIGTYHHYREVIAPYMGEDPETADDKYYENNFFTARQVISCLKLLYSEEDTYGHILELMKEGQKDEYFRRYEDRYEVAHKYGYLAEGYILHLNDCGVIFTDDPYLLVCFTSGVEKPYEVLGRLCTLMSDYTQYQRELRLEEEARQTPEPEAPAVEAPEGSDGGQAAESAPPEETPPAREPAAESGGNAAVSPLRGILPAAAYLAAAVLAVLRRLKRRPFRAGRLFIDLAALLAVMVFCFLAASPPYAV